MTALLEETLCVPGLVCPMPVLRAKKVLRDLAPGTRLIVKSTDPHAPKDFEVFCGQTGHRILAQRQERLDGKTLFVTVIERKGA